MLLEFGLSGSGITAITGFTFRLDVLRIGCRLCGLRGSGIGFSLCGSVLLGFHCIEAAVW